MLRGRFRGYEVWKKQEKIQRTAEEDSSQSSDEYWRLSNALFIIVKLALESPSAQTHSGCSTSYGDVPCRRNARIDLKKSASWDAEEADILELADNMVSLLLHGIPAHNQRI